MEMSDPNSVFLPDAERADAHIVDVLIEERCPSFVAHWTWPIVRPVLYRMLGYRRAVEMADFVSQLPGQDSFDHLARELDFVMTLNNIERIPTSGRLIIAANHPTGLADGVAVWEAVRRVRRDILFFANADAIRVSSGFADTIIPVEWVLDKRSAAKTKETLRRAKEAFENEQCVIIFPSGKLAARQNGQMVEKSWFSTVVSLAKKQDCPIIPMNLKAQNSQLYYFLSKMNGELRDITLFYELLNKSGSEIDITCGPLILPSELNGDAQALTETLKNYVSYELANDPHLTFADFLTIAAERSYPQI